MTIQTSPARATWLASVEYSNNPFLTGEALSGTYSTSVGTEILTAANAASGTTFDPWTATPSTGQACWQVVFASDQTPTFVAIAAHNLFDVDAVVALEYSTNNGSTWTDSGCGSVTPEDNQAIGFRLTEISADYWRLNITSASDVVSLGMVWIGSELIIPKRIYKGYRPPITPTEVDLRTNVSEGAQLLGSSYVERGSTFQASFDHLPPTFCRGPEWIAFQRRWNRGHGAFWGWRPAKYGDLFYAWKTGAAIAPENSSHTDYMSFSIQGRLYHDD
jgi:hypothetical protein